MLTLQIYNVVKLLQPGLFKLGGNTETITCKK